MKKRFSKRTVSFSRRLANWLGLAACTFAMFIGLFFLCAVIWALLQKGLPAFHVSTFTQMTPPPGEQGGLLNAIVGSALMSLIAVLIGTPIGILAGTYLAEYGENKRLATVIQFVNSLLLSTPSVVVGFFIYIVVVSNVGHFSAFAGSLALAMILIPIVTSNTENILRLVPQSLKEASFGVGASSWQTLSMVSYGAAKTGLLTGILLGVARISGESAPLLFTALNNQFWSVNPNKAMANLPVTIFQFAMSPYESWQTLAWGGALLITAGVLFTNVLAKTFLSNRKT